jgi:hypothetical protein
LPKACEILKRGLLLHPAKLAKLFDRLIRKGEADENKNFQKNFKNFLPVKK